MSKLRVSPRKSFEGEHVSFALREFERGVLDCAAIFPGSSSPKQTIKIVDIMSTSWVLIIFSMLKIGLELGEPVNGSRFSL